MVKNVWLQVLIDSPPAHPAAEGIQMSRKWCVHGLTACYVACFVLFTIII